MCSTFQEDTQSTTAGMSAGPFQVGQVVFVRSFRPDGEDDLEHAATIVSCCRLDDQPYPDNIIWMYRVRWRDSHPTLFDAWFMEQHIGTCDVLQQ